MTLHPVLVRMGRGFSRAWNWLKRKAGLNAPGWASTPVDDNHATYRRQYETLLPTLRHLPRGVDHPEAFVRRNAILYLAELVDGLHNFGDDPIMPPGVRRIVVRETQRLAQFGEVGRPQGLLGPIRAMAGGWQVWAIAGAITVSGWGMAAVQAALKERVEDQRDEAREYAERMEASRNSYAAALGQQREAHARDVAAVLETTAQTVEQLQRQRQRERDREARERSRNEDLANGNVNFSERLRELAEPAAGGLPAAPAAPSSGSPAGGVSTPAGGNPDADRTD